MQRLIGAVLLFVLFVAVHGSDNPFAISHFRNIRDLHPDETIAKRQLSNCSTFLENYPESCETALDDIDSDSSSEDIANALDEFCIPECIQPYVDYANCLELPQVAISFNNLLCGMNGNQYCSVIADEDPTIESNILCVPISGTCDASCQSMQESVVDAWGCCAASYYAASNATCDVGAGDVCDGVVDAGIVNRVGLGLITIFAMVAAFANAVLF